MIDLNFCFDCLVKPLQIIGNKSSANSFTSSNPDIQVRQHFISKKTRFVFQRLRKEMKVSHIQDSEIEDFDNIESIHEENDDDEDEDPNTMDETQRSVKLMLRSKSIEIHLKIIRID